MSRNTAPSMLSHPAIEHVAHFLGFLLLLKCFPGDATKNSFLQQVRSLGVIIRAIFELCNRFVRTEFPFGRRGKLGLLRVFLTKSVFNARPGLDNFSCWTQVFLLKKDYPYFFPSDISKFFFVISRAVKPASHMPPMYVAGASAAYKN